MNIHGKQFAKAVKGQSFFEREKGEAM